MKTSLLDLFAAAAFKGFGGIPLPKLTPSGRANHKKRWSGSTNQQIHQRAVAGQKECLRRLAFKERHGHFA